MEGRRRLCAARFERVADEGVEIREVEANGYFRPAEYESFGSLPGMLPIVTLFLGTLTDIVRRILP